MVTQFVSGKCGIELFNRAVTKGPLVVRGFSLATTNIVLQEAKRYIHCSLPAAIHCDSLCSVIKEVRPKIAFKLFIAHLLTAYTWQIKIIEIALYLGTCTTG